LCAGIVALIEAMKTVDRPVVTIGFQARQDREPMTDEHRRNERGVYALYLERHEELKEIEAKSPNNSAIIGPGDVFGAEQTARRESVILERLRHAVSKGIDSNVLALEPVPPGEQPMIEVGYHVVAAGALGTYSGEDKKIAGLLRWYAIDWTITIRPPKTERAFEYKVRSLPGQKLTYDSDPGDPSWAVYAVILFSGFYDMSANVIRTFGLDPGEAPNAFSFAAVARSRPDDKKDEPDREKKDRKRDPGE
jgi:hypothetical protein